ncbi:MAG: hypothetical protein ACM3PP_08410 [Candidatus Saccharibacteria bacterium]
MRKLTGKSKAAMLIVIVAMFMSLMSSAALAMDPQPEPPMEKPAIKTNIVATPYIIGPNFNTNTNLIIR